jgi:hypothetical protein|tara:strand:- start:3687 stop:3989 length:303 start_codon:yes stop_codon:yes gene_type:complete
MERVSHREYKIWMRHFKEELNQPSRSDHYLMQIAQEVKRVLSKRPTKIKMKDFFLTFGNPEKKKTLTLEEKTKESKSFWGLLKTVNTLGTKVAKPPTQKE